jgi:hypothetical protein
VSAQGGEHIPYEHELLAVAICALCHERHAETEFTVGEDQSEDQCGWCGDAGELVCCDHCPRSFCSTHVEKWCGREVLESEDDWKCFVCDHKLLEGLRGQLSQSGTPSKKGRPLSRSATSTPVSEDDDIDFGDQEQQVLVDRMLALEGAIDNALEELEPERLDKLREDVRTEIQAQLEDEFGAEEAAEPERLKNLVEQEVAAFSAQWSTELRRLQTQHAPLQVA